jgi:hypothetical protein
MIYVNTKKGFITHYYLGNEIPYDIIQGGVSEVQACGDELDWIRNNLDLPRMSRGRIVYWYGDDAQFIAGNFPKLNLT